VVAALDSEIFPGDDPLTGEEIDRQLWWIARTETGKAVGFLGAEAIPHNLAYISRVGVVWGSRGQGIQRRLVRACIRWARKRCTKAVITYTLGANIASANNFIREGFVLYEPATEWAGPAGDGQLYWWRDIDA
jgi:GNAT superfamily N-acetyltransferase